MSLARPETESKTRARTATANSSPASPRASFQWSGVEIGAYKIGREMARGGMGIVYEARHGQLERMVALKLMRGGAFGDIARFRAETEAVARLDHPNIVPIYEVGEFGDQPYFTMKRIDGGSLADRLRGDPISEEEIARLMVKVCRAVHHAHERGVLHRDLKPANILLDPPLSGETMGEPHLTDFGLAKFAGVESGFTSPGEVVGTPEYISPEQITANPGELTTASDVWALGVLLYQMLSGRMPFTASTPLMILDAVKNSEPLALRCNHDLATIVARCIEKQPSRRMPSAAYLAEELERWLRGEPIRSRHVTTAEKAVKFIRRNPWRVAAAAVLVISILTGSIVSFVLWQDARRANEKLSHSLVQSTAARLASESRLQSTGDPQLGLLLAVESTETAQRAGMEMLPESVDALINALQLTGGVDTSAAEATAGTYHVCEALPSPDGKRLLSIVHQSDRVHAALFACESGRANVPVVRWTLQQRLLEPLQWKCQWMPDSRRVLVTDFSKPEPLIRVWELPEFSGGRFEALPRVGTEYTTQVPDGLAVPDVRIVSNSAGTPVGEMLSGELGQRRLAYFQPFALDGSAPLPATVTTVEGGTSPLRRLAASKSGEWAAFFDPFTSGPPAICRILPKERSFARYLEPASSDVRCAAVSDTGRWCAFGTSMGPVELYDLAAGDFEAIQKSHQRLDHRHETVVSLAISPDEKWLLVVGDGQTAQLYSLEGERRLRREIRIPTRRISTGCFSKDSGFFAVGSDDKVVRVWKTSASEAQAPIEFRGLPAPVLTVQFSADTKSIHATSSEGSSRMWKFDQIHSGRIPLSSVGSLDPIHDIAISPDGRWIAAATARRSFYDPNEKEGTVRFFDTRGGLKEHAVPGHRAVTGVAFSPDGKWFASTGRDSLVKVWKLPELAAALDAGTALPTPRVLTPVLETRDITDRRIAFHPRGAIYATCGDGVLFEWDLNSDSGSGEAWRVHSINYILTEVKVSPDGKWLMLGRHGGDTEADIMRRATAIVRTSLGSQLAEDYRFLRRHWTQYGDMVLVFDCSKPGALPALTHVPSSINFHGGLAMSDDGRWMGGGTTGEKPCTIWDATTPSTIPPPLQFPSSGAPVLAVAFSPQAGASKWFATATDDGRVTLYDFKRGDAFTRRISTGDPIYSMGFLPDGRLATGGADGRLRIWETDADKLIELARETAGRELTETERSRFAR